MVIDAQAAQLDWCHVGQLRGQVETDKCEELQLVPLDVHTHADEAHFEVVDGKAENVGFAAFFCTNFQHQV